MAVRGEGGPMGDEGVAEVTGLEWRIRCSAAGRAEILRVDRLVRLRLSGTVEGIKLGRSEIGAKCN